MEIETSRSKNVENLKTDFTEEYQAYAEDLHDSTDNFEQANLAKIQVDTLKEIRDATIADKEQIQYMNNILLNKIDEKHNELKECKRLLTTLSYKMEKLNNPHPQNHQKLPRTSRDENFYKYF